MKEHPDDDKSFLNVQRVVNGWKLDVFFWGFDSIHVFASRDNKRVRWQVNKMFKRVEGHWMLDNDVKDKWVIRHEASYPGEPESHWKKTYSPPGSTAIVERMRKMVVAIANEKEAKRWRAEGYLRSRERRRTLEDYFSARKNLDVANARAVKAAKTYEFALASEKAYLPKGPRR